MTRASVTAPIGEDCRCALRAHRWRRSSSRVPLLRNPRMAASPEGARSPAPGGAGTHRPARAESHAQTPAEAFAQGVILRRPLRWLARARLQPRVPALFLLHV